VTLRALALDVMISLVLVGGAVAAEPPRADLPTYALGEKWIRSDGLYELVRVEDGLYVFTSGQGREVRLTKSLGPARLVRGQNTMEFAPPFELKWPLKVGERTATRGTWHLPPRHDRPRAMDVPGTFIATVLGWEEVTVTAGTVGAYRIEFAARNERSGRGGTFEAWYAPSVRQYVKISSAEVGIVPFEVVAFDRPAGAPLELVVEQPRDQAQVADEHLPVRVKVRSSRGVSRVALSVNGAEIAARDEAAPKSEVSLSQTVPLREGRNVVLVTATESDGTRRQESRVVTYERPAAVATPPPPTVAAAPATRAVPPAPVAVPLTIALSSPVDRARRCPRVAARTRRQSARAQSAPASRSIPTWTANSASARPGLPTRCSRPRATPSKPRWPSPAPANSVPAATETIERRAFTDTSVRPSGRMSGTSAPRLIPCVRDSTSEPKASGYSVRSFVREAIKKASTPRPIIARKIATR